MAPQDDPTRLMAEMNTTLGYLVPLIESLLKTLNDGDKQAMERMTSLVNLLDRIHLTIDMLYQEKAASAKADTAKAEALATFTDQQRRLEEAVLSLERRLETSEESAARQKEQVLELLALLR